MASTSKKLTPAILPTFSTPTYVRLAIQLGEIVMAQAEATLAPVGLTPREYDALLCIADSPDLSQQELSKKLGLFAPRMVSIIDGLERLSLVERIVSRTDRRRNVVRLTEEGSALLQKSARMVAELQQKLFGDITDTEHKRFQKRVERLAALPCPKEAHNDHVDQDLSVNLG